MRELMGCELAKQYPACLVKLRGGGRILGRDEVFADFGVARGADAGGRVDVLQSEWYAVQRPAVPAGHDLALRALAWPRAFSGVGSRNALSCGSSASMRASSASVSSSGDSRRLSISRAASAIVSQYSSVGVTVRSLGTLASSEYQGASGLGHLVMQRGTVENALVAEP